MSMRSLTYILNNGPLKIPCLDNNNIKKNQK